MTNAGSRRGPAACLLLAMACLGVAASGQGSKDAEPARNTELTNAAWDAYGKGDYEAAITAADRCIQRFKQQADRDQSQLANRRAPLPPAGKVSEEQKRAIFANGLLNDVATCYWIKGRSAEKLQRAAQANEAYRATVKYSYARTWDPKGWFWSPAEDAADRLQDLK